MERWVMNSYLIVECFETVLKKLEDLNQYLYNMQFDFPLWIQTEVGQLVADKSRLMDALMNFEPTEGLSPQQTFVCPGAVGGSILTFDYIKAINVAKDAFNQAIKDYMKTHQIQDTALIRQVLASAGHTGIKLKQVTRQIITVNFHPRRIAFTQARNGSNKTISIQEAMRRLQEIGQGEHIDIQLALLSTLKPDERLSIHRDIKHHPVVNVATFKDENNHSRTTCIYTSLPIFYLHDYTLPMPKVMFSKKTQRHQKNPRADKQLEEKPFLPSISAYRYRYNLE